MVIKSHLSQIKSLRKIDFISYMTTNFYNEFNTPTLQDKHVDGFRSLFCFKMLKEIWEGENMMKWLKMV